MKASNCNCFRCREALGRWPLCLILICGWGAVSTGCDEARHYVEVDGIGVYFAEISVKTERGAIISGYIRNAGPATELSTWTVSVECGDKWANFFDVYTEEQKDILANGGTLWLTNKDYLKLPAHSETKIFLMEDTHAEGALTFHGKPVPWLYKAWDSLEDCAFVIDFPLPGESYPSGKLKYTLAR